MRHGGKHGAPAHRDMRGRVSGGNPGNRGGGRHPYAFREECLRALIKYRGVEVVAKIAAGDILEQLGTDDDGQPIIGQTKNADRIQATKFLASYAIGLPVQPVEDITPREPVMLAASALLDALPRLAAILPGGATAKAKMLAAVDAEYQLVE